MRNKKLIAGALAGILGLGAYLQFGRPSIESVVKKEFDSFPTEIQGAKSVKKYETEGAKYCLVHVKQIHVTPQMSIEPRLMVMKVQSEVYSIISELDKKYGLNSVYIEGETQDSINRWNNTFKANYATIKEQDIVVNTMIGERAWMKLAVDGIVEVKPAEKEHTKQRAIEVLKDHTKFSDIDLKKIALDDREDAVLEIISSNRPGLACVIYGRDHRWKDNVDRWNKKYTDKKYGLIEIMPNSTDDCYWNQNTDPLTNRLRRLNE